MKKTKMLKKNYEFKNVLTKGKYYSGKRIEAFIKYNNSNISNNFLGIAISSKIAKAVRRNKIKRLIRESYKNLENNINTSNSIIFLWKKNVKIEEATYKNIMEDMKNIIKKANIFIEEE
ncbi:MAG: ribonuclease P protein component [Clostridia bacterium]|nr:ribonuclease P protein component [Clostridia bacterium]